MQRSISVLGIRCPYGGWQTIKTNARGPVRRLMKKGALEFESGTSGSELRA